MYGCVVYSVQCSMWSMKWTGAGAGAGAVCSVQCATCSVQCPACRRQGFITSNQISLSKLFLLILAFKNLSPQLVLNKYTRTIWFFKALNGRENKLVRLLLVQLLKSIYVTPPVECRISAKSIFLMIDMKSLYKCVPKDGYKHWILI